MQLLLVFLTSLWCCFRSILLAITKTSDRWNSDIISVTVVAVTMTYSHCISLSLGSIVIISQCHQRLLSPTVGFTRCFLSPYVRVTVSLSRTVRIPQFALEVPVALALLLVPKDFPLSSMFP